MTTNWMSRVSGARVAGALLAVNGTVGTFNVVRQATDPCGGLLGAVLDTTGSLAAAQFSLYTAVVNVIIMFDSVFIGGAYLVNRLRETMLTFMTGDGTAANTGLLGNLYEIMGPFFLLTVVIAVALFGLFTIARYVFTFSVTSGERVVLVTILAMYLVASGSTIARAYDTLRENITRAAFNISYEMIRTTPLPGNTSLPPFAINCSTSTNDSNFCSSFYMALGFLMYDGPDAISFAPSPLFQETYYRYVDSTGTTQAPVTADYVAGLTCHDSIRITVMLNTVQRGIERALQGLPVAVLGLIEEIVWLLFGFVTLMLFVALGVSVVFAVFSSFGNTLTVILNALVQTLIAATIAGVIMGMIGGLALMLAQSAPFFFVVWVVIGAAAYFVLISQVTGMMMGIFAQVGGSVGGIVGALSIPAAAARINPQAGRGGGGRLAAAQQGLMSGAMMGMGGGPGGVVSGALLGAGAGLVTGYGGAGAHVIQNRLMRQMLNGQQKAVNPLTGGDEGPVVMAGAAPSAAPRPVSAQPLISVDRARAGDPATNQPAGQPVPERRRNTVGRRVTDQIGVRQGGQVPVTQPGDDAGQPPTQANSASAAASASGPSPVGDAPAAPDAAAQASAKATVVVTPTRLTPRDAPPAQPLTASGARPGAAAPAEEPAWVNKLIQSFRATNPGANWRDGMGGQVNYLVRVARDNYGLPPESLAAMLRAQADGSEAARQQAVHIAQRDARNTMTDHDALDLVRHAAPLARYLAKEDARVAANTPRRPASAASASPAPAEAPGWHDSIRQNEPASVGSVNPADMNISPRPTLAGATPAPAHVAPRRTARPKPSGPKAPPTVVD